MWEHENHCKLTPNEHKTNGCGESKNDELERELQSIYASNHLAAPKACRPSSGYSRWRHTQWRHFGCPSGIANPLVVWTMRETLSNPCGQSRVLYVLGRYFQLKQQLHQFAVRFSWAVSLAIT